DSALVDAAAGCGFQRCIDVLGGDVLAVHIVQQSVPGLADNRRAPVELPRIAVADLSADERIPDDPDAMCVRQPDRRRERPRLADPLEPGQLAVAVQPMATGKERRPPR